MRAKPDSTSAIPRDTLANSWLPLACVHLPLVVLALGAVWSRCPAAQPWFLRDWPAARELAAWLGDGHALWIERSGPLGILALVTLIELVVLGWSEATLRHLARDRSIATRHDLGYLALSVLGWMPTLTVIFTAGAFYAVVLGWGAGHHALGRASLATGNLLADVVLFYLVLTFVEYWWHRAQHSRRLWPIHRAHHAATRLTPLAAYRGHPAAEILNPLTSMLPLAIPCLVVPMPVEVAAVVATVIGVHNKLEHTMLPWTLGWVGRWLLVSPIGHRIHHSPLPEHADRNFSTCPLWDRLFGTWYDGPVVNEEVGLAEAREPHANLLREWVEDLRDLVGRPSR